MHIYLQHLVSIQPRTPNLCIFQKLFFILNSARRNRSAASPVNPSQLPRDLHTGADLSSARSELAALRPAPLGWLQMILHYVYASVQSLHTNKTAYGCSSATHLGFGNFTAGMGPFVCLDGIAKTCNVGCKGGYFGF